LGKDEGNCTTPTASGTGQAVVDNTACTASAVSLTTSKIAGAATVSPIWTMTNDPHWNEIMVDVE